MKLFVAFAGPADAPAAVHGAVAIGDGAARDGARAGVVVGDGAARAGARAGVVVAGGATVFVFAVGSG